MKNFIHVLLCSFIISSMVTASSVSITWSMGLDDIFRNQTDFTDELLPVGSLFLLYWSSDQTPSELTGPALDPFSPGSNEFLIDFARNSNPGYIEGKGGTYTDTDFVPSGIADFGTGYVFTRVFDYQGSFDFTPGQTPTFDLSNVTSLSFATSQSTKLSGALPTPASLHEPFSGLMQVYLNQTIMIPEPGTLAMILMAVGGIVYKIRRRRS